MGADDVVDRGLWIMFPPWKGESGWVWAMDDLPPTSEQAWGAAQPRGMERRGLQVCVVGTRLVPGTTSSVRGEDGRIQSAFTATSISDGRGVNHLRCRRTLC